METADNDLFTSESFNYSDDQVILTTKLYKMIMLLPYLPVFCLLPLYVLMW